MKQASQIRASRVRRAACLAGFCVLLSDRGAYAQTDAGPGASVAKAGERPPDAADSPQAAGAEPGTAPEPNGTPPAAATEARLTKFEARLSAAEQKNQGLRDEVKDLQEQLASTQDSSTSSDKLLSAWGYFDVMFGRAYFDNSRAFYRVAIPSTSTFSMSGINLFLKSEPTQTLSALVETMLTFSPDGVETQWATDIYVGSTKVKTVGESVRTQTTGRTPMSALYFRQNGLSIVRAHADWKPVDWFALRVGRFLTPFGIWNEDHGSPVLLGVDNPQLMNFDLVPLAQTGLEVFGTRALSDNLRVDYAFTFSNGRGPVDDYQTYVDQKAVGLRVKAVYSADDISLRLGGYAYHGIYRDRTMDVAVQVTPSFTLDPAANPGVGSTETITTDYADTALTGEAEVKYKRFRMFGEIARRSVIYNTPSPLGDVDRLVKNVPFGQTAYDASHYGLAWYAMAAYEIPLLAFGADIRVSPYVSYDYVLPSSTVKQLANRQYRGGLNIKPSPYVTCKLEAVRIVPEADTIASRNTFLLSQVAVSF